MCINIYVCINIYMYMFSARPCVSLPASSMRLRDSVPACLSLCPCLCLRLIWVLSLSVCVYVCVCVRMCVCARANHFIILHSKEIPMRNSKHPSLWANVLEQLMALINFMSFMSLVIRHFIENMSFLSFMSRHFISCRLIQTERFCSNRTYKMAGHGKVISYKMILVIDLIWAWRPTMP